jgi:aquaporin NIP
VRKALAEFIGTFALVFAGCGAAMVSERFPGTVAPGAVPVVFGLVVAAMIYAVGHISGAHFNPAVTLAFAVGKHFPRRQLLGYWAAQFLGALAACGMLVLLLPDGVSFGATVPRVSAWQALGWEILLSFFLMFVIISVATDTRAVGTMAGAAIGATVMLAAFVGGPVTGASMNPARSLAPALFERQWVSLWVYFLGPGIGAVAAALVYNYLRRDPKDCMQPIMQGQTVAGVTVAQPDVDACKAKKEGEHHK